MTHFLKFPASFEKNGCSTRIINVFIKLNQCFISCEEVHSSGMPGCFSPSMGIDSEYTTKLIPVFMESINSVESMSNANLVVYEK